MFLTSLLNFILETKSYYVVEIDFELKQSSCLSFLSTGIQVHDIMSNNPITF